MTTVHSHDVACIAYSSVDNRLYDGEKDLVCSKRRYVTRPLAVLRVQDKLIGRTMRMCRW